MGNLNKVMLIGRLGQDPEKRVTPAGHSVISISLATTEHFSSKDGQKQERTEWHKLVFWNKQAELIEQYCKKGSQLYIEGSLQTNEWQDKDGNKRYTTEIVVRNMQFLDSKPQSGDSSYQGSQGGGYTAAAPASTAAPGSTAAPQNQPQNNFQTPPSQGFQPGEPAKPAVTEGNDFIEDDIPF